VLRESLGDHIYRMAVTCLAISAVSYSTLTRAVYIAWHDRGKALVGFNVTSCDGIRSGQMLAFVTAFLQSSHVEETYTRKT
jgi:hypothetical protein